jgi:putative inorganic carbon (HCO3(-)) transporter
MSAVASPTPRSWIVLGSRPAVVGAAALAAVVLAGGAVYSPRYAVIALAAAALACLAFWRLALAVAVFTVLTFPEHLPGSLGIGATVAKPLGLVLALAWIATVVERRGSLQLLVRDSPVLFWTFTALVAFSATSAVWAPNSSLLAHDLGRLLQMALLLFVVYTASSTSTAFRTIIWAFLVGSVVTAAYSIATGAYAAGGRLAGLFDPNYFAAELIPAILVSGFLLLGGASRRTRLGAGVVLAFDGVAVILTQSRGGVSGLAVALLAAVVVAGRLRPRVLAAVLVVAAMGVGYYAAGAGSHLRAHSSSGRVDEWHVALRVFADHPLHGVGLGNYTAVEPSYATRSIDLNYVRYIVDFRQVVHNSYLEVAAELGVVGLLLFVGFLGATVVRAGRALVRDATPAGDLELYARGLLAGVIGMLIAYVFLSAQYEKQLWLVLGLLASVPALVRRVAPSDPTV